MGAITLRPYSLRVMDQLISLASRVIGTLARAPEMGQLVQAGKTAAN